VVSLFTGGASCCFAARVYRFDGTTYQRSLLLPLGSGYRLRRIVDGEPPLFVTASEFWNTGSHACAGYPLRLVRYQSGVFTDVTRGHRAALRRDARRWRKAWGPKGSSCDGVPPMGSFAAYLVDLERLHRPAAMRRAFSTARRRGFFRGTSEARFRRSVRRFGADLRTHAYDE